LFINISLVLLYFNCRKIFKRKQSRADKGFNVHTAMNIDGGSSFEMIVKFLNLEYLNNVQIEIPGVIGIFPRD